MRTHHFDVMLTGMPEKKIPLGPTGERVRSNIRRARLALNMTYAQLSAKLADVGRPIPTLGLSRLEAGDRRVDVDDLAALCLVLKVGPGEMLAAPEDGEDQVRWTPEISMDVAESRKWVCRNMFAPEVGAWLSMPPVATQEQVDVAVRAAVKDPVFLAAVVASMKRVGVDGER